MPDLPEDPVELEERFRRHGVSMRHLKPWWFRICHLLGLRPKPPILFSLAEHFYWEGTLILLTITVGWLVIGRGVEVSSHMVIYFCGMAVVIPLINWLVRRRIRARIAE